MAYLSMAKVFQVLLPLEDKLLGCMQFTFKPDYPLACYFQSHTQTSPRIRKCYRGHHQHIWCEPWLRRIILEFWIILLQLFM